jgi:Integrase zinc binding domain
VPALSDIIPSDPHREPESATTVGLGSLRCELGNKLTGTGIFKHLVPWCLAASVLSTEMAYTELQPSFIELLLNLQARDRATQQWKWQLPDDAPVELWQLDDRGLLRHKGSVYMPEDPVIRQEIIKANHDDPYMGYFRTAQTIELVRWKYYWPSQAKDIKKYVRGYDVCQRVKMP